jgi:serine/threonine-protein phosphatase PP1 catalytic subunit
VDQHNLDLICVSGDALDHGYEFCAGRKLVKLFTSPNYMDEFDNPGAIMEVDESLQCSFQVSDEGTMLQEPKPKKLYIQDVY